MTNQAKMGRPNWEHMTPLAKGLDMEIEEEEHPNELEVEPKETKNNERAMSLRVHDNKAVPSEPKNLP